jgi:predicted transcriptional regulator
MPTLEITVDERDHLDQRTRRRIENAQEGKELNDAQPVLNIGSYVELSRLLSPKNLELLEATSEHESVSIRQSAELVERDYKQVHRNLSELEDISVIKFERSGAGQAKNPTLAYDGLEIEIPFHGSMDQAEESILQHRDSARRVACSCRGHVLPIDC